MPKIVDKDEIRKEIIEAFERCIEHKPIDLISLRDIAAEAGMSHPKLINYFGSKDEIVMSYIRYTKDYMTAHCVNWFKNNHRANYESNLDYLNAFMKYVANGEAGEVRPNATTQTYVLGHYNEEVSKLIMSEFAEWRRIMEACLVEIYGDSVGRKEAEAMMIIISGTFICNYNNALTGEINDNILGYLSNLSRQ